MGGGGGGFRENQYIGGIALKGGLGQFADLKWGRTGLGKKEEGGAFEGRLIPQYTLFKDSYRLYVDSWEFKEIKYIYAFK